MELKGFLIIFATIFVAELGDKTQVATLLFATDKEVGKLTVFFAASAALILTSAIGVLAGSFVSDYISERYLQLVAGVGFVAIGAFSIYNASKLPV